tara:strand:- start:515 stop:721 length:207 start_codon:yes stop_codon:yes gene_type:complete|eukprot:scaffold112042_cov48-Phaeocystis_antarctica.AAC.2
MAMHAAVDCEDGVAASDETQRDGAAAATGGSDTGGDGMLGVRSEFGVYVLNSMYVWSEEGLDVGALWF